tara:strand:+ start:315 stop:851 length:537 start_codon:yes stop_codon:yes gene_type:complete
MNNKHKHHIIPVYRCKELGIDPDFEDNYAYPTREQHALIHWGYKCKDLSPLLEVCNPPQYVMDIIPLGDNRDVGAAVLLAEGEIDGIDMSGKNHPNYKHGWAIGAYSDPIAQSAYEKEYRENPVTKPLRAAVLKRSDDKRKTKRVSSDKERWASKTREQKDEINRKHRENYHRRQICG